MAIKNVGEIAIKNVPFTNSNVQKTQRTNP